MFMRVAASGVHRRIFAAMLSESCRYKFLCNSGTMLDDVLELPEDSQNKTNTSKVLGDAMTYVHAYSLSRSAHNDGPTCIASFFSHMP